MKRNPARGAFFNTAGREIRREKCKRGNIWRNSGEFIFIAVLHPVVDFESSESIVPASIFAKGSKIGKLTRLQIPNFYFFLQTWQHLESLENCIDGLKFIFCSKWIGYWPISLWKGRSVHFVAEDWTFPEIDREMVPKLSKRVSNTTSLRHLKIFRKKSSVLTDINLTRFWLFICYLSVVGLVEYFPWGFIWRTDFLWDGKLSP